MDDISKGGGSSSSPTAYRQWIRESLKLRWDEALRDLREAKEKVLKLSKEPYSQVQVAAPLISYAARSGNILTLGDIRKATAELPDNTPIEVQDYGLSTCGMPIREAQVIHHQAGVISKDAFTEIWIWVD